MPNEKEMSESLSYESDEESSFANMNLSFTEEKKPTININLA